MCQSGLGPEAELHWEEDKKASLSRCANLKHVFARTARDCPDVTFLTLEVHLQTICLNQVAFVSVKHHADLEELQAMHTKNVLLLTEVAESLLKLHCRQCTPRM